MSRPPAPRGLQRSGAPPRSQSAPCTAAASRVGGLGREPRGTAPRGAGQTPPYPPPRLRSPPRSVHPLPPAPGGALGDPRSPWSDLGAAGPRPPGQIAAYPRQPDALVRGLGRRPAHLRAPSRQVQRQLAPLRHFYSARPPCGAVGGRAVATRFPPRLAARLQPRGSLGPRDAAARLWHRAGGRRRPFKRGRCSREFANTNGNQGRGRRDAHAHGAAGPREPRGGAGA